jgi:hypothetical protein
MIILCCSVESRVELMMIGARRSCKSLTRRHLFDLGAAHFEIQIFMFIFLTE